MWRILLLSRFFFLWFQMPMLTFGWHTGCRKWHTQAAYMAIHKRPAESFPTSPRQPASTTTWLRLHSSRSSNISSWWILIRPRSAVILHLAWRVANRQTITSSLRHTSSLWAVRRPVRANLRLCWTMVPHETESLNVVVSFFHVFSFFLDRECIKCVSQESGTTRTCTRKCT